MEIKVDDLVTFTHVSHKDRAMSLTTKTGKVKSIDDDVAIVIVGKKEQRINISYLRKIEQKSTLTEFAETVFAANRKSTNDTH